MSEKPMTINEIEALGIKYSWQGYKDGKKVYGAHGWYPVAWGYSHGWGMMVNDIKKRLQSDEIDEAIIKKTRKVKEK